ncbi:glycoside hydrolase family 28 protein [Niveomyces insectorum RCEF 264]|uniref:galacturonan 1,4-alpha-galacturonidase n=1 Tax=Niveomyces insectorum RCEF 264 TaxID=1081102 RepID=A0A167WVG4_9HYPO|nr:glycoside hydrolase family 28 protein [Niveomyces insectorum RCEF 264]
MTVLCLLLAALLGTPPLVASLAWEPPRIQPRSPISNGKVCRVTPLASTGNGTDTDDVPQILQAFSDCNGGGTVVFAEGTRYSIASRLHPVVTDVTVEWRGTWVFSPNLTYWRGNAYPIAFQNHHAGFVLSGERIRINGHGTGGIDGSGDSWYDAEHGNTQPGRPMPFVLWNVSDVVVEHFSVVQSPLWSINVMNGSNLWFDDVYVNSTALNAPPGVNWVQNTDGFDTMDAYNVALTNFVGDDAIAIKPRSFNIYCQNITVHGGNGVAVGSLGQYADEDASVANVVVRDVRILARNKDMHNAAYIKTWVGEAVPQPRASYESAGQPNGGGHGSVTNVVFANFYLQGAAHGPVIDQDNGNNGSLSGTSNMLISNVAFVNFTGVLSQRNGHHDDDSGNSNSSRTAQISCSTRQPCYNIDLRNITLQPEPGSPAVGAQGVCKHVAPGGVHGMTGSGC